MKTKLILLSLLIISCRDQNGKNIALDPKQSQTTKVQTKEVSELFALEDEVKAVAKFMESDEYAGLTKKKKLTFLKEKGSLFAKTVIQRHVIAFKETQEHQMYSVFSNINDLQIEIAVALKLPLHVGGDGKVVIPNKTKKLLLPIVNMIKSRVDTYPVSIAAIPYLFISDKGDIVEHSLFRVLNDDGTHFFVSSSGRYYKSIAEWGRENKLPKGTVWYPQDGFLQASEDGEALISSQRTQRDIETVTQKTDRVVVVGGLMIGVLGFASLFSLPAAAALGSLGWIGYTFMGYFGLREGYKLRRASVEHQGLDLENPRIREHATNLGLNVLGFAASGLIALNHTKHLRAARLFSHPAYKYTAGFIIGTDTLADTVGTMYNLRLAFSDEVPLPQRTLSLVYATFFASRTMVTARHNWVHRKQKEEFSFYAKATYTEIYKRYTESPEKLQRLIGKEPVMHQAAAQQHKVTNKKIRAELNKVDKKQLKILENLVKHNAPKNDDSSIIWPLDHFRGSPLDKKDRVNYIKKNGEKYLKEGGVEYLKKDGVMYTEGDGVKSISLGTAREFTNKTGRELSVIYDRTLRRNVVLIGGKNSVILDGLLELKHSPEQKRSFSEFNMIWHTHPYSSGGKAGSFVATYASFIDSEALKDFGNKKSFVIPSYQSAENGVNISNYLRMFHEQKPTFVTRIENGLFRVFFKERK